MFDNPDAALDAVDDMDRRRLFGKVLQVNSSKNFERHQRMRRDGSQEAGGSQGGDDNGGQGADEKDFRRGK